MRCVLVSHTHWDREWYRTFQAFRARLVDTVDRVLELIRTINQEGVSVFMVEQNASLALEIAHEAYVLQTGKIVLSGPARTLKDDPRVRDAYLGGSEPA